MDSGINSIGRYFTNGIFNIHTGMELDTIMLHRHIVRKLRLMSEPQRYLTERVGVSRATMWRLTQGHELKTNTLLKLVEWLDEDINKYIIKGVRVKEE